MAYTKTNWVNDQAPAIDATNLNKIETGIAESRNVALLAVDSTAPEHCSEGDLYYNTTTKKIYEAIDTDVWDSTGVDPIGDILYIIFSTKTTYSYDGTDLVSVGGGGAEVSVSTTQPTEDEILWINPEETPSGSLNPITNEYSVATDKGYSCNYLNGVVLYNDTTGTIGNITLSDTTANYRYIEIYAVDNDSRTRYFDVFKFNTSSSTFHISSCSASANNFAIFTALYTNNGTTLTNEGHYLYNGSISSYPVIRVMKIIGYK